MYIGPWQEYKLSQNQNIKLNSKEINEIALKNQLLLALKVFIFFLSSFFY